MDKSLKHSMNKELGFRLILLLFEFSLSVRVSFLLVGAGRMPRRCTATYKCIKLSTESLAEEIKPVVFEKFYFEYKE